MFIHSLVVTTTVNLFTHTDDPPPEKICLCPCTHPFISLSNDVSVFTINRILVNAD